MGKKEVVEKTHDLVEQLVSYDKELLKKFPIETYVGLIRSYSDRHEYHYIGAELESLFAKVGAQREGDVLPLYHKLALANLICQSADDPALAKMPEDGQELCWKWFGRVLNDFDKRSDEFYSHQNDSFLKDLGVCSLRMVPVGAAVVEVSGIAKRELVRGGLAAILGGTLFGVLKTGGFKPFYRMHTDRRNMKDFSRQGWKEGYLRICELLKLNPQIKGALGASWFYDPNLRDISPELSYLAEDPMGNGARIFCVGTTEADIKNATGWSAMRKRLYSEGKYMPAGYLLAWPRREMIEWADKEQKA